MLSDGLSLKIPSPLADNNRSKMHKLIKKDLNSNVLDHFKLLLKIVHKDINISNKQMLKLIQYIERILHSIVKVHVVLLLQIDISKNLITTVNTTSNNMTELVDLLIQIVTNNRPSSPPFNDTAEGEKSAQAELAKEGKHNTLFVIKSDYENVQPATPALKNLAPA
ncbi:hypothetical protein Tco_0962615 [Tanacetum coccineum]